MGRTFSEKILGAPAGSIVFRKPDLVLSHDNTSSIIKIFESMGGHQVKYPSRLVIVLDHDAPPTCAKTANGHKAIREFAQGQAISKFYDVGRGICHQLMSSFVRPNMIVVGSDSHTCTAGAFNTFAVGIDRTETAGVWKTGKSWFRVPESMKITLRGRLKKYVSAKDLALWLVGMLGSAGADYLSVEFHGNGVDTLSMPERMTLANLASEMGAKNAVFHVSDSIWADSDATYKREIEIDLSDVFPVVSCPHQVDNVKAVSEMLGTALDQVVIGTCTNGRLEDLKVAANILKNQSVCRSVRLFVVPASRGVFYQALKNGYIESLVLAGAVILSPSCGPCLGMGQGIPADGDVVLSTANRNFLGRMGNPKAKIFLASPTVAAYSAIIGVISDPRGEGANDVFPFKREEKTSMIVQYDDYRRSNGVWNYSDVDDLNTDMMFSGDRTYTVSSAEPEKIVEYLFENFDPSFSLNVRRGDILIAGENFGCGSSREHPTVGLAHLGVKAIIAKSVSRIFFRSAINQGLPVIVLPKAVEKYSFGDTVGIDFKKGVVVVGEDKFLFPPLPSELMDIVSAGGLVNCMKSLDKE